MCIVIECKEKHTDGALTLLVRITMEERDCHFYDDSAKGTEREKVLVFV